MEDRAEKEVLDNHDKYEVKKVAVLESLSNGATVTEATEAAGVARTIHYYWLKTDENYRKGVKESEVALADSVEDATVRTAKGFEYDEVHEKYEYGYDKDNNWVPKLMSKEVIHKKHAPNVAAQIFLDCNLKSEKFKNTQKIIHLGKDEKDLFTPFTNLSKKELDGRIDAISARLTEHEKTKNNGS